MSSKPLSVILVLVCTILTGLAGKAYAQAAQGFKANLLWETGGFSMPESVVSIAGHPWLYVSNVNGEEQKGFISRVSLDGNIDTLTWVSGIQTPTGMVAHNGQLYVVDQTQVHQIDIDSAVITKTFTSETATSLNDIDITSSGDIYISELQAGKIHRIQGDKVIPWSSSEFFPVPNGVLADENGLLVGNVGDELSRELTPAQYGAVSRISFTDGAVEMLEQSNRIGTWDGLALFADGFMASSPFNGELWYFYDDRKSLIAKFEGGIADIGADAESAILYAPMLFANKVAAFKMEGINWRHIRSAASFNENVVDHLFGDADGQSIARSNGTIEGTFGERKLTGTWEWQDEYFCRQSQLGEIDLGADCLVIELTDTQMRLTLNKGNGPSVIYDRK